MLNNRAQVFREVFEDLKAADQAAGADANPPREKEEPKDHEKLSQAEILIKCAKDVELFHGDDEDAYARIEIAGHFENHRIASKGFRRWLQHRYWLRIGKPPGAEPLRTALSQLEARAFFEGKRYSVHLRIAEHDGAIYVDLCDHDWKAVEITATGWLIVNQAPVRFIRTKGMLPLPEPEGGGNLLDLRQFLNLKSKDDFVLLVAWLLGVFRAEGPFPILALYGEQGSAKSTAATLLRMMADPSRAPLRSLPRDERDLFIAAGNGRVLAFDNVSHIPDWMSDAFCRLSTGGGFSTRALYTDAEEQIIDATRPILLTAIEECISRSDLADRALPIELARITDEKRKPLADVMRQFEAVRPKLLGSLCNALAHGLREFPGIRLNSLPRMADFARWAVACELALWREHRFLEVYSFSRADNNQALIDADTVATAVREFAISRREMIEETASQLLSKLNAFVLPEVKKRSRWPKTAKDLSGRLKRASPALRKAGIEIEHTHRGRGNERQRIIRITPPVEGAQSKDVFASPSSPAFPI